MSSLKNLFNSLNAINNYLGSLFPSQVETDQFLSFAPVTLLPLKLSVALTFSVPETRVLDPRPKLLRFHMPGPATHP
jgi:hypothetical protein